ncbi:hypothetical protein QMG83_05825 [Salinibacterium sp. G-O1]|uniref:hypothetical protein n=1 Tax=Salinibacterium sp. G-O1 TaxID=3046208 RepID=UPI0024BA0A61|nr:hypothetical protein [Salinibacterium sp. G-O1]MDJ0334738.1 hypothetical protein [Salinibacterium sp. G-O1]
MIEWFENVQVAVAIIVGLGCIVLGLAGRTPNDYTLGATLLVGILLIAQLVVSLVAPATGNLPTGSGLEFWVYLVSAVLIPPAAIVWALIDRNRWSTVILGVACLAVAVMLVRMGQIWFVQVA